MTTKEQRDQAIANAARTVHADRTGFLTHAGSWRPRSESAPDPLERRDEKTED